MEALSKKLTILIIAGGALAINLIVIRTSLGFEKLLSMAFLVTVLIPVLAKTTIFALTPTKPQKPIDKEHSIYPTNIKSTKETKQFQKIPKEQKTKIDPRQQFKKKEVETDGYIACRDVIKACSKNKLLKREDILDILEIIDNKIGSHVRNYRSFVFENDMHEIYIKLKSNQLSTQDYFDIMNYTSNMINKEEQTNE